MVVTGLPDRQNEGLRDTISKVATALNITFLQNEVVYAERIKHSKSTYKPLIIRFTSEFTRDSWIAHKRAKRDLYASEISLEWPHTHQYI